MEQAELYANMPENAIGAYTGVEQLDPAITEAEKTYSILGMPTN